MYYISETFDSGLDDVKKEEIERKKKDKHIIEYV